MRQTLKRLLLFIVLGIIISSCNTLKPPLSEIPPRDKDDKIYYLTSGLFSGTAWNMRKVTDSTETEVFSYGADFTLFPVGEPSTVEPSVSPSGDFLAVHHAKVRLVGIHLSVREMEFGIYDTRKGDFVLDLSAWQRLSASTYRVQWSMRDSAFFYVDSDTLKRSYPNGSHVNVIYQDELRAFSVSPSERLVAVEGADTVKVINLEDHTEQVVATSMDSQRPIWRLSWNSDETLFAFIIGWRVNVYDVNKKSLTEYQADGEVFSIEWLPGRSLVYVEGDTPSDMAVMKSSEWFHICKLNLDTGEKIVLHERYNHEPFSVRPRLSPSGKLLLFSERKLNGPYEVKLMSLDGQQMNTICEGRVPCWGR